MAYYLVKYEGLYYVNRELAKAHFNVGDAGLFALIADGVLVQRRILDCCVYGEGPAASMKLPKPGKVDAAVYQDLDAQTAAISAARAKEKIPYTLPGGALSTYALAGTDYIRLKDLYDPMKYRLFGKFPSVTFLGSKYVALNAASEDSGFVVRIKQ